MFDEKKQWFRDLSKNKFPFGLLNEHLERKPITRFKNTINYLMIIRYDHIRYLAISILLSFFILRCESVNENLPVIQNTEIRKTDDFVQKDTVHLMPMSPEVIRKLINEQSIADSVSFEKLRSKINLLFMMAPNCGAKFSIDSIDLYHNICQGAILEDKDFELTNSHNLKCVVCKIQLRNSSNHFITISYSEGPHSTNGYYLTSYKENLLNNLELLGEWYGSEILERITLFSIDEEEIEIKQSNIDRSEDYSNPKRSKEVKTIDLNSL